MEFLNESDFIKENPLFSSLERSNYSILDLRPAFPEATDEEIEHRLHDNRLGLRRSVERFGYLGIRSCNSRFFNIDEFGCRSNGHQKENRWGKLSTRVNCYGGSTTLGVNVADNETISSYLAQELGNKWSRNVSVSNYGAGNHTSLHSSLRLLDHVLDGNIPDIAVFLNGFNDCFYSAGGADGVVPFLDQCLMRGQSRTLRNSTIGEIAGMVPRAGEIRDQITVGPNAIEFDKLALAVKERYRTAVGIQEFIGKEFGVKIFRFFEPTPFVSCRPDQYLVSRIGLDNERLKNVKTLYESLKGQDLLKLVGSSSVISLVEIGQDKLLMPLFVDVAHFTPQFNNFLAQVIASHIEGPMRHSGVLKLTRVRDRLIRRDKDQRENSNPDNYPLF